MAQLLFSEGGLSFSVTQPNVGVSSDATHRIVPRSTAARVSLRTKLSQAAFSGRFELTDPHWNLPPPAQWIRRVPFQGMIILSQGHYSGHGYFLLPQLPLSDPRANPPPTWSGKVSFLPTNPP
jgi:hypothetical protein